MERTNRKGFGHKRVTKFRKQHSPPRLPPPSRKQILFPLFVPLMCACLTSGVPIHACSPGGTAGVQGKARGNMKLNNCMHSYTIYVPLRAKRSARPSAVLETHRKGHPDEQTETVSCITTVACKTTVFTLSASFYLEDCLPTRKISPAEEKRQGNEKVHS